MPTLTDTLVSISPGLAAGTVVSVVLFGLVLWALLVIVGLAPRRRRR